MSEIMYRQYLGEADLPHVMELVQSELSEPYVIYTFRYFLHHWPHLSFIAHSTDDPHPVGVIVCKQSVHRGRANRGYIAMLSVSKNWRKRGIASSLVRNSIEAMKEDGVDEIVLETEYDNHAALSLYESLGFIREKRLHRFYLNGKDAFRLVLPVPHSYSDDSSDTSGSSRPTSSFSALRRRLPYGAIRVSPYSDEDDDEVSGR
ncbi:N-alpha-acetyltransferase 30 [Hypsizygus marmoreus]|uniref:N-alpha-acetyltransferase 30 n=1 Tax=Hypsizygus marmoreus TaxID=39966 RepID=A0A369JCJ7_HYPMA|nr:N-alpha-acetyltransferase 30 [Hypsizygus marmoreus]